MKKILLTIGLLTTSYFATAQNTVNAVNDVLAIYTAEDQTSSVLNNDTFNGNPATSDNVTIELVTTTNGFIINSNGTININWNVPSGSYNINYKICEKGATQANCSTAMVIIYIANPIDAANDVFNITDISKPSPAVTQNDTLDGSPVVLNPFSSNVALQAVSVPSGITMLPDGTYTFDQNIQNGSYVAQYQICEIGAIPANCDLSTVTININKSLSNPSFEATESLRLYPNPVQDILTIDTVNDNLNYSIYNAIGIEVKKGNLNEKNNKINTESLEKGVYFIQLGSKKTKFIKA